MNLIERIAKKSRKDQKFGFDSDGEAEYTNGWDAAIEAVLDTINEEFPNLINAKELLAWLSAESTKADKTSYKFQNNLDLYGAENWSGQAKGMQKTIAHIDKMLLL